MDKETMRRLESGREHYENKEYDRAEAYLLKVAEAVSGITGQDDSFYVIDPVRGMMVDFTDAVSFELVSKPEQSYALNVEVAPTGRVRICSDSGDQKVPGFEEC